MCCFGEVTRIFLRQWGVLDSLPKSVSLSQLRYWCWLASAVVWLVSTSSSSILTTSGSVLRQSVLIWSRRRIQQQQMFLNPKQAKKGMPRAKDSDLWAWTNPELVHWDIHVLLHNKQGLEQMAPLLCIPQSCGFLGIWAVEERLSCQKGQSRNGQLCTQLKCLADLIQAKEMLQCRVASYFSHFFLFSCTWIKGEGFQKDGTQWKTSF